MDENDGFEDLTETKDTDTGSDNKAPDADTANDSPDADADVIEESAEVEVEDTSAGRIAELEATIEIHVAELGLKNAEIAKWKNANLQLLLQLPNDATVGEEVSTDNEDDGDDPVEEKDTSGSASLFTTKE